LARAATFAASGVQASACNQRLSCHRPKNRWMSMAMKMTSMTMPTTDSMVASHACGYGKWLILTTLESFRRTALLQ
jgi:hypothetical protein